MEDQITLVLVSSFLVIVSLLAVSLYRNNQIKFKTNDLLQTKNSELRSAVDEAERALKEKAVLNLPEHLLTPIQQYLAYFTHFVKKSKKVEDINFTTTIVNNTLEIRFDLPRGVEEETVNKWLDEYMNFLFQNDDFIMSTASDVTKKEYDFIVLGLKSQISNFKHQLEISYLENKLLERRNDDLKETIQLISNQSHTFFVSSGDNKQFIGKEINASSGTQIFGNKFDNSNITFSNIDEKILEIIKQNSKSIEERKSLEEQLEILKSKTSTVDDKKKAGGFIKKFIESSGSELGKKVVNFILDNGESWWESLSNINL